MTAMYVLVTNDDGIDSEGLSVLAATARRRGHAVTVVAPCWDSSGASASLTGVRDGARLVLDPRPWPGWPAESVYGAEASPALIVRLALGGDFGHPPDIILSGINRGANTGRAILHSGTVGAALTAYNHGCPGLAVSLATGRPAGNEHWDTAAAVAGWVLDWLVKDGRRLVINCNVPDLPEDRLAGVRVGRLATIGAVESTMTQRAGGAVPLTFGEEGDGLGDVTDAELLARDYACVTAVVPVSEDPSVDLTAALAPGGFGGRPRRQ
ncbi:MAG TPA: 5'/3'-nucleotidase SurE [Acidimicrobiales bacterium]|nr:5'/3'-nucleotidase SurE [Acidimicrobiales bacterium]